MRSFEIILVTGPHRAGTTITTAMIANDLDYQFFEEPETAPDLAAFLAGLSSPAVVHCPSYCHQVHEFAGRPGLAVMMVRRPVKAILKSQRRVGWGFEQAELAKYPGAVAPVARVKYDFWETVQKPALGQQAFEIEYGDLSQHPMWVPAGQRRDFHIAQLEQGKPRGDRIQNPELVEMRLNIGPGQSGTGDKMIDLHRYPGVTDVADIAVDPLPYPNNTFDEVVASHVLEHIPTAIRWREYGVWNRRFCRVELMREIYRVLKPGGVLTAVVPVVWPRWAQDPTHDSVPWCQEQFGYFAGQWGGNNPGHEATESSGINFGFDWVSSNETDDGLTVILKKPETAANDNN